LVSSLDAFKEKFEHELKTKIRWVLCWFTTDKNSHDCKKEYSAKIYCFRLLKWNI